MRTLKNLLLGLALVVAGLVAMLMLPSPQPPASKPWEITRMPDGNIEVLGIHLGQTRYREAQQQLGEFGETALFTDPDGQVSLEAYFDSINLGGLSAKLVLNLGVDDALLADMLSRAQSGKLQPSGARQHELHAQDRVAILDAPVIAITYIPTVRLRRDMLESRFGEADRISQIDDDAGSQIWHYDDIGLDISFNPAQRSVLLYRARSSSAVLPVAPDSQ